MLLAKGKIAKIVILRSGALGDVLAVRSVIRFFKDAFPRAEICLVAPGERGRFFERDGWADHAYDSDRAAFSWLHTDGASPPPAALRAVFSAADIVVSYLDFPDHADLHRFEECLTTLAPAAGTIFCPSRPPDSLHGEGDAGHDHDHDHNDHDAVPIDRWLLWAAMEFCRRYALLDAEALEAAGDADCRVTVPRPPAIAGMESYYVIHPGSGDKRKNWPVENYMELARLLRVASEQGGAPVAFRTLVATSGEADGDLGARLALAAPAGILWRGASLEDTAGVLAHAEWYIGNDSGITHLAASVKGDGGRRPKVAAIFGPSDPDVWAPPGALVLDAGSDMRGLDAAEAFLDLRFKI